MKKLLAILSAITFTTTPITNTIGCQQEDILEREAKKDLDAIVTRTDLGDLPNRKLPTIVNAINKKIKVLIWKLMMLKLTKNILKMLSQLRLKKNQKNFSDESPLVFPLSLI